MSRVGVRVSRVRGSARVRDRVVRSKHNKNKSKNKPSQLHRCWKSSISFAKLVEVCNSLFLGSCEV